MTGTATVHIGRASSLARWSALPPAVHRAVIGSGTVLALLGFWELVVGAGLVSPLYASSPGRIVLAGRELFRSGEIWNDLRVSATEFLFGYLLAAAIGIPLGLSIGLYRRVNYLVGPFVDVLNAVPRVTFLPILILWFGIGIWSKLAVVFLGAVIPITIATTTGVRTNEARFIQVAKSFGASQWKLITSIILPGTIPFIFTGLKYGSGRALLGVVVGELYASTAGVGHMIAEAGNTFDVDTVFFGVLLFTAAGLAMTSLLNGIERSFDRWRPEAQAR
jgi:ABC-type nitrate/sulfonate/bicarbonate transport system permease component